MEDQSQDEAVRREGGREERRGRKGGGRREEKGGGREGGRREKVGRRKREGRRERFEYSQQNCSLVS